LKEQHNTYWYQITTKMKTMCFQAMTATHLSHHRLTNDGRCYTLKGAESGICHYDITSIPKKEIG
jgi:hypothetical protein